MTGLSRTTFRPIPDDAHLAQSVQDILTTPIGTRVLRRTYGSEVPGLLDAPLNGETLVDLYMAVAEALDLWEPRMELTRVQAVQASPGAMTVNLEARVDHTAIQLSVDVAVDVAVDVGGAP